MKYFDTYLSKYLLLFLVLSYSVQNVLANDKFRKISTIEGLSQNYVNGIFQDSKGFMWIATNDGLNRFDGYSFKTYQVTPFQKKGVPSNLVFRIQESEDGSLWVGTSDQGVHKFDVKRNSFYSLEELCTNKPRKQAKSIGALYIDSQGWIWIGSNNGVDMLKPNGDGTFRFYNLSSQAGSTTGLIPQTIYSFQENEDGAIIISGSAGVYFSRLKDRLEGDYKIHKFRGFISTGNYDVVIFKDRHVLVWQEGVDEIELDFKAGIIAQKKPLIEEVTRYALLDSRGVLWCSALSEGLSTNSLEINEHGELIAKRIEHFGVDVFGNTDITYLYESSDGIVWVGLNGIGLYCYVPQGERFRGYNKTDNPGSVGYNKIRSIFEDSKNNLWIGSEGKGVSVLPAKDARNYEAGFIHKKVQPFSHNLDHVYAFAEDINTGKIYSGNSFPLTFVELQLKNNRVTTSQPEFGEAFSSSFDTYIDKQGVLWVATYGKGVEIVFPEDENGRRRVISHRENSSNISSISSDIIRSLMEDDSGNIWIGTDNGLNLLLANEKYQENPKFKIFKNDLNDSTTISHNYILPIVQTSIGDIWVGTMGGGLNKVVFQDDEIIFEKYTKENGVPSNVIKAIIEDNDGLLWFSSNRGISSFNTNTKKIINYDINDGLQDYEFGELAACKRSDGEILFGGVNGFNAFYPEEIGMDLCPPKIVITDLLLLNEPIEAGEEFNNRVIIEKQIGDTEHIKLRYAENSLALHFSALHYAAPAKNQYRYKLEGFDEDWIKTGSDNRIAKYTYLPHGEYTFMVEGTNLDGVWCSSPSKLKITIKPPWYRTTLGYILYYLIAMVSVFGYVRYSNLKTKQKAAFEMERFEKNKAKELSDMKLRFFTNISHEFRTPLTLILGPLERLISEGSSYNESKRQSNYSIIQRNAAILLRLINQLMDFRKFEQGKMKLLASSNNIAVFLDEIFSSFQEYAKLKDITFEKHFPDKELDIWFDKDKLEKIIYNLLSNAFKFTQPGGKVVFSLTESIDFVTISVADTGLGMSEDMQKHVFKRFYQSERIRNRKVGSTGIGLSFTKGLVELHHGKIDFQSVMNEGSTFFVELMKGDAHLSDEEKLSEFNQAEEQYLSSEGMPDIEQIADAHFVKKEVPKPIGDNGVKVLIVEDNDDLRKFMVSQFAENYNVGEAYDGKQGFEMCIEMQPDIVVSDVMMPNMDGYELCDAIKSDERTSHIPIVLLTAKTSPEYQLKGFQSGADAYVPKPFQYVLLKARITAILESREKLRSKYRRSTEIKPSEITMTSADEKFLVKIVELVENNISEENFTVEQLSSMYGLTQNLLNKKLKSLTGHNSKAFIRSIRMKRAAQLLELGRYTVADVTYEVGMNDLKYFRQCFKAEFGMTPSDYMKENVKNAKEEDGTEEESF